MCLCLLLIFFPNAFPNLNHNFKQKFYSNLTNIYILMKFFPKLHKNNEYLHNFEHFSKIYKEI